MKFRPCIDLHLGKVKQIIGSSLNQEDQSKTITNFQSEKPAGWFAELYKKDDLKGGHIIRLGEGNDQAAKEALGSWPSGMQLGGGVNDKNAKMWLDLGASHLIITSFVFKDGVVHLDRLNKISQLIGKKRLVLDLSCKKKDGKYFIVTDYWQKFSKVELSLKNLDDLGSYCSEILIHAADVEGKQQGVDDEVVNLLGEWGKLPVTYAGGIHSLNDLKKIKLAGNGQVDFTVGSALDIFGGEKMNYSELVNLNKNNFNNI